MARRRGAFRFLRAVVTVLVALAVLAVVADRALAWFFEQGAESATESSGARGAQVTIHGFPFLTQLASGRIGRMSGHFDSGTFSGYAVDDVTVDARDVVPRDPFVAQSVEVDGLLGFDAVQGAVSETAGTDVEVGQADRGSTAPGTFELAVPVRGIDLTATVAPTAADGSTIGIDVREVSLDGVSIAIDDLPGAVRDELTGIRVPLDLPDGVTLAGVSVESGGLRIALDAVDIPLTDLAMAARPGAAGWGGGA